MGNGIGKLRWVGGEKKFWERDIAQPGSRVGIEGFRNDEGAKGVLAHLVRRGEVDDLVAWIIPLHVLRKNLHIIGKQNVDLNVLWLFFFLFSMLWYFLSYLLAWTDLCKKRKCKNSEVRCETQIRSGMVLIQSISCITDNHKISAAQDSKHFLWSCGFVEG